MKTYIDTIRFTDEEPDVVIDGYEKVQHTPVAFTWFWDGGSYTVPLSRIRDVSSEVEGDDEDYPDFPDQSFVH